MRCLSIQIQPPFVASFDRAEFLQRVGALSRSPEIDKFTEQGKTYLSFNFFTEMPALLWRDLQQHLYLDATYGPSLSACSIVVCEGKEESDDYLVLHHFDPLEVCTSVT